MDQRSAYASGGAFLAAVHAKVQSASGYSVRLLTGDDHSNQRSGVLLFKDAVPPTISYGFGVAIDEDTELTDALATQIAERCVSAVRALVSSGQRLVPFDDHSNQRIDAIVLELAPTPTAHMIGPKIYKDTKPPDALATHFAEQCARSARAQRLAPGSVTV